MAKIIQFPLEMADGAKVRTLEELQEHYDIASVIKYYKDGRLQRWLKANYEDEIAENLQESEKQSLKNIFSVLELPEPSDEDLKNVDLRSFDGTTTEDENLKAEIKKHLKDTSLLDDWKIFQNESDTKDKCVIEFENEKLQTFTGKTFEKGENFEKDVADFLTKLIDFHTKPTVFQSTENIKVGYIAYSDGSVSEEYDRNKTPVGIVIEVTNGTAAKIVSLDETEAEWSTEKVYTNATIENNGMPNLLIIQRIDGWETEYPAFKWCDDYTDASGNSQWYLPAEDELNQLYTVKKYVNAAIDKITAGGGIATKLNGEYWSSSQYSRKRALVQYFSGGDQFGSYKNNTNLVRAVRAF